MTTMATCAAHRARPLAVVLSACLLALGVTLVPAMPARAEAPPFTSADQAYYSRYSLESLRSQGYTGEGVIIAVIDGHIDTSMPELSGARIENKSPCTVHEDADSDEHGTIIAQLLVSSSYGVAPGATIYNYDLALDAQHAGDDCAYGWSRPTARARTPHLIEQAINDGADIISISSSFSSPESEEMRWALARAIADGVIIVGGMGNDATRNSSKSIGNWNGVVGVSALETDGRFADYSNWGDGVSAAAVGEMKARSPKDRGRYKATGTSFSAPLVAGVLALAMQRFGDDVTVEQILQAMAHTASGTGGQWDAHVGYGEIDPVALLSSDPSRFPDSHPFADKGGEASPTWQDVEDYIDGVVDPRAIMNDWSYAYRGFDEEKAISEYGGYPSHLGTSPRYHAK